MRFALLGNHPDGLAFAAALVATGRHTLAAVYDAPVPDFAPQAQLFSDAMEILADPVIELVIIAGALAVRDEQLRRAVQSERAVACVHPSGEKPDIAYEAALIQGDTKKPLLPLLTEALHPAVARLSDLLAADAPFRLLLVERWITAAGEADSLNPSWPVLRRLGGEIVEVLGAGADGRDRTGRAATGQRPLRERRHVPGHPAARRRGGAAADVHPRLTLRCSSCSARIPTAAPRCAGKTLTANGSSRPGGRPTAGGR